MSRYSFSHPKNPSHTVTFGFDHALGFFYDICDAEDEVLEEKCSLFNKLSGIQLHTRLTNLLTGDVNNQTRFKSQLDAMALDLSF